MTTITVTADRTYPVIVGRNLLASIDEFLAGVDRVAVIYPSALSVSGETIKISLSGVTAIGIEIPNGEDSKSAEVLEFCWHALGQAGFTRNDLIISVGGGATTDVAGFAAATWLRGVNVLHIPTTLLGMVDAAIGGKTGINTADGKNLVGAFHSPVAVLCDLNALESLERNDYISGLAEVIKAGFIRDPKILELIESDPAGATSPAWEHTQEIIERAIQVKADVVSGDLRETLGTSVGREILNYGHTFAHAIERVENYRWRHGAAVSVGMVFIAHLARLAGRLSDEVVHRHVSILKSVGLPTTYVDGRWDDLLAAMKIDKKSRGDLLRFVILDDIAKPAILEGPDPTLPFAAYQEIVKVGTHA
ncbi:MAG: 3-dehydroquinate synthase [Actinobacteria bacterium]|nr:3-dehydroquinate synthase [Actinomycetota bacterium]